jgi:hypothetical protein
VKLRSDSGKIKKGDEILHWWTFSTFGDKKSWYFTENNVLARYEVNAAWTSKRIDFLSVKGGKTQKQDFKVPSVCFKPNL